MGITTVISRADGQQDIAPGPSRYESNETSFEVCSITFDDAGNLVNPAEALTVVDCIDNTRRGDQNGVIVVCFVHGWHHSPRWDDEHFVAFREVLAGLSLREAERYLPAPGGRRVIGIYLGWNGDPENKPLFTHLSFWNRYEKAEILGRSDQLREILRKLISATKDPSVAPSQPESPFVLVGHSMGGLIVESTFLSLLTDPDEPLRFENCKSQRGVEIRKGEQLISFPDAVIAINSAADSAILRQIKSVLQIQEISKTVTTDRFLYPSPLIISFTSTADNDTGVIWPLAKPGRCTDGHDKNLHTHNFSEYAPEVECHRRPGPDFGQNWHCLRPPISLGSTNPTFPIDLPSRERVGIDDSPPHSRYQLTAKGSSNHGPVWVFQVPPKVVSNHNDIFNSRSASLLLALIQLSGAVASLARDLDDMFEDC